MVLFASQVILTAAYCIQVLVEYDEDLENMTTQTEFVGFSTKFVADAAFLTGKIIVIILCNGRLYYTFTQVPNLRISKRFYYAVNTAALILLPLFEITGLVGIYTGYWPQTHFCDAYRVTFIVLITTVCIMFNQRLYQQTTNRKTVRNLFAMEELNEATASQGASPREQELAVYQDAGAQELAAARSETFNFRTATGRSVTEYMTFDEEQKEDEQTPKSKKGGLYFLLDIITRYALLITIMNVSVIICAAGWNTMYFTDNLSNPIPLMLPLLIQAFDGALNAFCLLLFYSYGDGCYAKLCLCNDKESLRCCALHRCCESCCVGLAKKCV